MRPFDTRFKAKPPPELIDTVTARAVGDTLTVRAVTFTKIARNNWSNDFRDMLTDRDVATVLAEEPAP